MKTVKEIITALIPATAKHWMARAPENGQAHVSARNPAAPFRHPGYGDIEIRPRDGKLEIQFPDNMALISGVADFVGRIPSERVGTFFENHLRKKTKPMLEKFGPGGLRQADREQRRAIETIRFFLARRAAGRYQDFFARQEIRGSEVPPHVLAMSQGVPTIMHWRGIPLAKTVFDISLYMMMLWDLRPRTIIEIGSASGGSAAWLADVSSSYGLDCHVYSLDIRKPSLSHPKVTFILGDSKSIEKALPTDFLSSLPHPWLFIEDAHVNVAGVLGWIHAFMVPGDYLIVEDTTSETKEAEIVPFMIGHRFEYKVDTHYTDFFGYNACSSRNSIWRRV